MKNKAEKIFLYIVIGTILLSLLHFNFNETSLIVEDFTKYNIETIDDTTSTNLELLSKESELKFVVDADNKILKHHSAGVKFNLRSGTNLNSYDSIYIWAKNSSKNSVAVTFTNQDTLVVENRKEVVIKDNQFEFYPSFNENPVKVGFSSFSVPFCCLEKDSTTAKSIDTKFNNIVEIEVKNGKNGFDATIDTITVTKVAFYGERVSDKVFMAIVFSLWGIIWAGVFILNHIKVISYFNRSVTSNSILRQKNKSLQTMLQIDPLTKVFNRNALYSDVDSILEAENLSIVIFDIDLFKSVNDTHGHNIGDDVLRVLAQMVNHSIREKDALYRWGGEEFLVICKETSIGEAIAIAEILRSQIENYVFGSDVRITGSFGVTKKLPTDTIRSLIHRADLALYEAKRSGRNRVERCDHSFENEKELPYTSDNSSLVLES